MTYPRHRGIAFLVTLLVGLVVLTGADSLTAQEEPPASPPDDWGVTAIDYSNVPYPYPTEFLPVEVYGRDLRMAYMDVAPTGTPNGRTVVLFHGMNFFGAVFGDTMERLTDAGFRAIAIDRLGYGRSSKPIMQYNLHIPARNTKRLLDHLGIDEAAIVGHSMGGMVASRFAMTYPERTSHVVMVNQIGLSDQRPGREWSEPTAGDPEDITPQEYYESVLRSHQRYYVAGWDNDYLEWVKYPFGLIYSGEFPRWLDMRARQGQILYEDEVVYDWQHIDSKALVIGGAEDPLSRDFAAEARHVAEELQNAQLILYDNVGHAPAFEIPERFHADLIEFLRSDPNEPADQSWRDSDWGR
ncbi:MAG: alpha/beta hydrolase [Longimicrobiales bacterium]|nr:alpha/beta hydrolase [Longimicrobiales bacterium]